jgi:hypothetical protein
VYRDLGGRGHCDFRDRNGRDLPKKGLFVWSGCGGELELGGDGDTFPQIPVIGAPWKFRRLGHMAPPRWSFHHPVNTTLFTPPPY